jgi:hypothetical protein
MPRGREYKFKIEAYQPDTMPLGRLTEYLKDLTDILGEERANVHLVGIEAGSTVPVLRIDPEAEPKVLQRFREIETEDASLKIREAVSRINRRLRLDGAKGAILDPEGADVFVFLGAERAPLEYGPFNQPGTLDGVPILIGGTLEEVPIHLEGMRGEQYNYCFAYRDTAKAIAQHLFTTIIRLDGVGRWLRHAEGDWELIRFRIRNFTPLAKLTDISLKESIEELRGIPAKWKEIDDPVGELMRIRDDVEM